MDEIKALESPFSKKQLEFRTGEPNKSHPAVRPDDKRLTDGRAKHLPFMGNKPGVNGGLPLKPLAEALRKKMEETASAEGKTFAELWAELVLEGARGRVNMTPCQRDCIQIIRDTLEGKPGTAKEEESGQTMIVWGEITAVDE